MAGHQTGAMKRAAAYLGLSFEEYTAKIEAGEKWCVGCKAWHPVAAFGVDKSRGDGLSTICISGRKEKHRAKYIRRPRTSKLGAFFVPARDGDKEQARARVNHHIKVGLLPDPNALPCADCGHVCTEGERRHEYDHHQGYAAEHQLDVEAVCTICHRARGDARGEIQQKRGDDGRYVPRNDHG